jgi:hypothetical protein
LWAAEFDPPADRIAPAEVLPRQRLVDERSVGFLGIAVGNNARRLVSA